MEFNTLNTNIPTLKQVEYSFQRYRNPLNEFHQKSESNSFEQKNGEFQINFTPYLFFPSTPIYPILGTNKQEQDVANVYNRNQEKVLRKQQSYLTDYKQNLTTFGCKKICEIDCLLIERYYNQKSWIFQNPNQKYKLKSSINNRVEWFREKLKFRYKAQFKDFFEEMIELIEQQGEIYINAMTSPLKLKNLKMFQNLERQLSKSLKSEQSFENFLFEIQKVLADYIFSKLN